MFGYSRGERGSRLGGKHKFPLPDDVGRTADRTLKAFILGIVGIIGIRSHKACGVSEVEQERIVVHGGCSRVGGEG